MADSNGGGLLGMNELEVALRGPDGKAAAEKLITRINQLAKEIEVYKQSGLSTVEYSRMESINKALVAARGIVLGIQPINLTKDSYP
jgi:hypothetical protein